MWLHIFTLTVVTRAFEHTFRKELDAESKKRQTGHKVLSDNSQKTNYDAPPSTLLLNAIKYQDGCTSIVISSASESDCNNSVSFNFYETSHTKQYE